MKHAIAFLFLIGFILVGCGSIEKEVQNPVPDLVKTYMPEGFEYIADYVTTQGGDKVWVTEVSEPAVQIKFNEMAVYFREFAKAVDTTDVSWLKISVLKSEAFVPYAQCVPAGPARAAARGDISDVDLLMAFTHCPGTK